MNPNKNNLNTKLAVVKSIILIILNSKHFMYVFLNLYLTNKACLYLSFKLLIFLMITKLKRRFYSVPIYYDLFSFSKPQG